MEFNFWSIVLWVILGGVAGWLASIITGRNSRMGCIGNIFIGILGAIIGGYIIRFFGGSGITGLDIRSILIAVLGAAILLVVTGWFQHRNRR